MPGEIVFPREKCDFCVEPAVRMFNGGEHDRRTVHGGYVVCLCVDHANVFRRGVWELIGMTRQQPAPPPS